jgi:hypothetical protein
MSQLRKNRLICPLFIVLVLSILVQLATATVTNFTVYGGEEAAKPLGLFVDDRVVIKFTVVGGESGSLLDFWIAYPNGTIKASFENVGSLSYSFVCSEEGEYHLHFSNLNSSEDKLVSMDYEVQHYLFGIPQMLFQVVIIVVVCMAAVAVFVLMRKPH